MHKLKQLQFKSYLVQFFRSKIKFKYFATVAAIGDGKKGGESDAPQLAKGGTLEDQIVAANPAMEVKNQDNRKFEFTKLYAACYCERVDKNNSGLRKRENYPK